MKRYELSYIIAMVSLTQLAVACIVAAILKFVYYFGVGAESYDTAAMTVAVYGFMIFAIGIVTAIRMDTIAKKRKERSKNIVKFNKTKAG